MSLKEFHRRFRRQIYLNNDIQPKRTICIRLTSLSAKRPISVNSRILDDMEDPFAIFDSSLTFVPLGFIKSNDLKLTELVLLTKPKVWKVSVKKVRSVKKTDVQFSSNLHVLGPPDSKKTILSTSCVCLCDSLCL